MGALAMSEATAGSDVVSMKIRADERGKGKLHSPGFRQFYQAADIFLKALYVTMLGAARRELPRGVWGHSWPSRLCVTVEHRELKPLANRSKQVSFLYMR